MYTVWHVDKYKVTFKLVIDHWPRAWRLRNTVLECIQSFRTGRLERELQIVQLSATR
jgi:hypothetical protein